MYSNSDEFSPVTSAAALVLMYCAWGDLL